MFKDNPYFNSTHAVAILFRNSNLTFEQAIQILNILKDKPNFYPTYAVEQIPNLTFDQKEEIKKILTPNQLASNNQHPNSNEWDK
jgi:hypothetical protein